MADLRLVVNGVAYGGWTSLRVRRSLEEIAGAFSVQLTEIWPEQSEPREIASGDACSVDVDGDTVITGFVERVAVSYDSERHQVEVSGRDATGDLVSASAMHRGGEWTSATLTQIARDVCAPFGIRVRATTDVGAPFATWAIQEGESAFETLDRAARHRGVLLLSDGRGGLLIARPADTAQRVPVDLVRGQNILSADASVDHTDRFSRYVVKGQAAGDDDNFGETVSSQEASATDPGVRRHRPLVIIAEDQADAATFSARATFEANWHAARAQSANVTVQGWSHPGGLWAPGALVALRDPWLRLDRELLIASVDLVLDERGSVAELSLAIPQAFSLMAVPETAAEELF